MFRRKKRTKHFLIESKQSLQKSCTNRGKNDKCKSGKLQPASQLLGGSRLEIRDAYEYGSGRPEPDTEVDGLMPLDGIDLIGVDWEMPSDRGSAGPGFPHAAGNSAASGNPLRIRNVGKFIAII